MTTISPATLNIPTPQQAPGILPKVYSATSGAVNNIVKFSRLPASTNPIAIAANNIWGFLNPYAPDSSEAICKKELSNAENEKYQQFINEQQKLTNKYDTDPALAEYASYLHQEEFAYNNPQLYEKLRQILPKAGRLSEKLGIGLGFIAPQVVSMFLENGARAAFQAENMKGAQAAIAASTLVGSIPGMLIGNNVVNHFTFDAPHYNLPAWIKALTPLMHLGVFLSHNVSPLFEFSRSLFDFKGLVGIDKPNAFGKAMEFLSEAFNLFSFTSMTAFALNHLSEYNNLLREERLNPSAKNLTSHKLGKNFQMFGFAANLMGAGVGLLSRLVATFMLKPKMEALQKQEEAAYAVVEPQIAPVKAIVEKKAMELEAAVKAGKMTEEQAQQEFTKVVSAAKAFMSKYIFPKLEQLMAPIEAEKKQLAFMRWIVQMGGLIGNLGISLQMASGTFQGIVRTAAHFKEKGSAKSWKDALWQASKHIVEVGRENNNRRGIQSNKLSINQETWLKLVGGMAVPVLAASAMGIQGLALSVSEGSPLASNSNNKFIKAIKGVADSQAFALIANNLFF